jgi:amidase
MTDLADAPARARTELAFLSAAELAAKLSAREIGARELLEHHLARVERHNPALNAVIWMDADRARAEADASDRRRAAGEALGPLDGIPMTVKESYDLAGAPTTWGVPEFTGNIATRDSAVVERLRAAGAVIYGKTNVPLMLADWQSFNAIYGTTNNPWDLTRAPGGSSGGSAAALAAGLSALEAGSDIGASIRNPAHYCGVFGHKPTWGIVSGRGQKLPGDLAESDIAVVGPLARSAGDLKTALDIMAGPDGPQARGWRLALPGPRKSKLADFRVSVVLTDPVSEVDRPVQDAIARLAAWLEGQGATVEMDARPDFSSEEAHEIYIRLLRSATSKRLTDEQLAAARRSLDDLGPEADRTGYKVRMWESQAMGHRDWLRWNERRHRLMAAWEALFETYDLMLCPAAASAAFPHDQEGDRVDRTIEVNGRRVPTTDQLFWAGYPCASYLPGTVAPIGLTEAGLPVGVQIVGRRYDDLTCLHMAGLIEKGFYGFTPPQGY